MPYTKIRLYGSDVDYSTNNYDVPKATLDGAGVDYLDLELTQINGQMLRESESVDFFGNLKKSYNSIRYGCSPESTALDFSTATDFESFYGTSVLNKSFNYLYFDSTYLEYQLVPASLDTNADCLCVNVTSVETIHDKELGIKKLMFGIESTGEL